MRNASATKITIFTTTRHVQVISDGEKTIGLSIYTSPPLTIYYHMASWGKSYNIFCGISISLW